MSRWSDDDAAAYCKRYADEDLALRVYTSRLLGRDSSLVLHGGGNTSVKTTTTDELGREVEVLCVKGSGWDMAEIEPVGLPAVCLAPLRELRALDELTDEAMVNAVRRNLMDVTSPTPSVETLLHAFLPHKFIDHTHADAVLVLANQPDGAELCSALYGDRMGIVPYIMPGFQLAKKAVEVFEDNPDVEGLILINHGIFTFGSSAQEAYCRMIDMVAVAREHIASQMTKRPLFKEPTHTGLDAVHGKTLAVLRGCLSSREQGPDCVILIGRVSEQINEFLERSDLDQLATRGPITPDHVIRTKQKPLILPRIDDLEAFKTHLTGRLDGYIQDYQNYFETQTKAKGTDKKALSPLPVVFLMRGIGLVTAACTVKAANIAADLYEHTIDTLLKAEHIGRYQPLPDQHIFDMEYWSLEQAKLGKKKARPMEGRVALVTGATGGIGHAISAEFAAAGSNLIITDLDLTRLQEMAHDLESEHGTAVVPLACDMTNEDEVRALLDHAAAALGGIDVVISNAGTAPVGPIAEVTRELTSSLEINLMAHQFLASATTSLMRCQGMGGCLLFNASKSAFNPGPGFGAYSIPKAALIALMKQYAIELADDGIRAMAVNADRVRTPLLDMDAVAKRARARGLELDAYFRANLLGQEVRPQDVARAFYHLYLSVRSTGTLLTVDGGNIAASPR